MTYVYVRKIISQPESSKLCKQKIENNVSNQLVKLNFNLFTL